VTDTLRPATVRVAVLLAGDVLGDTSIATVPGPVPEAPLVRRAQLSGDVADHAQPGAADTSKVVVAPDAGTVRDVGVTV
jgi:hypothetical protein